MGHSGHWCISIRCWQRLDGFSMSLSRIRVYWLCIVCKRTARPLLPLEAGKLTAVCIWNIDAIGAGGRFITLGELRKWALVSTLFSWPYVHLVVVFQWWSGTLYEHGLARLGWIGNYFHSFVGDLSTHTSPYFNGDLTNLLHGWAMGVSFVSYTKKYNRKISRAHCLCVSELSVQNININCIS